VTGARARAFLLMFVAAAGAAALALAAIRRAPPPLPPRPPEQRPRLLLLTSLPLLFGEDFSLQGNGSPALNALQSRYHLVPISLADRAELAKGRLLLMAQPPAQTAQNLVLLDQWVRRGGRLLLLADPQLDWPSKRPLGDLTRPPPMFIDTGLLAHWGLRLNAPDRSGPAERKLGGFNVVTVSPGTLHGRCSISADQLAASCRVGAGTAAIIADADMLNVGEIGTGARHNLDALLAELAMLEHS
jgi:hypothetical protein